MEIACLIFESRELCGEVVAMADKVGEPAIYILDLVLEVLGRCAEGDAVEYRLAQEDGYEAALAVFEEARVLKAAIHESASWSSQIMDDVSAAQLIGNTKDRQFFMARLFSASQGSLARLCSSVGQTPYNDSFAA
jgi:hypothetical protein